MPFTFAHPAAVLPFRRYCPSVLNFPALVVGSMTPDVGYYFHNWQWAVWGHSFVGSLTFDVPAGLLFLAVYYLSLRPVAALLPDPHRQTVLSWKPLRKLPGLRSLAVAALSILLGSWTHIVWDGFTHANGWCVRTFSALTPTVFSIGSYNVTVWQLLQHSSTLFGLYVLWRAYLAETADFKSAEPGSKAERLSVIGIMILPAVIASVHSFGEFKSGVNMFNLASFAYVAAVRYVDYLLPSLLLAGMLAYICRLLMRKTPPAPTVNMSPGTVKPSHVVPLGTSAGVTVAAPVSQANSSPIVSGGESGNFTHVT